MDLESQLNAVLNDPEKMAQVMAMAQSLGLGSPPDASSQDAAPQAEAADAAPAFQPNDPTVQAMMSMLRESAGRDDRSTALLQALRPMLRADRQPKIDRAIRAARMAKLASVAFRQMDLSKGFFE